MRSRKDVHLGSLPEVLGWDPDEAIEDVLSRRYTSWIEPEYKEATVRKVREDCVDVIRRCLPDGVKLRGDQVYASRPMLPAAVAASVDGQDLDRLVAEGVDGPLVPEDPMLRQGYLKGGRRGWARRRS